MITGILQVRYFVCYALFLGFFVAMEILWATKEQRNEVN